MADLKNEFGLTEKLDKENVDDKMYSKFTRANIEALENIIHLVDSDEENKLDMFCYLKCTEKDDEFIKQCRGLVYHGQDLVLKSFPYTMEYNHTEKEEITKIITDMDDWIFYDSYEGTLLRVFFFGGKWYTSTHRKLNAFRSKWSSRESFGTSFKNALTSEENSNPDFKNRLPQGDNILERLQESLDKKKQYMFLLRNTKDNRIVCNPPERPTVYHVGTFSGDLCSLDDDISIGKPVKLNLSSVDSLIEYVSQSSYKTTQGIIGFNIKQNKQLKIVNKDYQDLFKVRGNEPSIKFRYLQVRMNKRYTNMLHNLYPEMTAVFDEYENTIFDIARSIYRAYVQRFIKKRYVTVPREEFAIIKECHSWHMENRFDHKISIDKIMEIINKQMPTNINHMIRRFKLEKAKQSEKIVGNRQRTDSVRSFEQSPVIRKLKNPIRSSEGNANLSPLFLPATAHL